MTTGMSTPEFFGIFLAAASSVASVLFMMVAYSAATARHFRVMLQYLRLAGVLSMASWIVMLAVMFRCEHVCWVVRNKPTPQAPALQIVSEPVFTVSTPNGHVFKWGKGRNDGSSLPGVLGRSDATGGFVRASGRQL